MDKGITGIILAGGKSSRMGKDKGFCTIDEKPLIRYAIETLSEVCDSIIIGTNNPAYDQFGFPVVPDKISGKGPVAGIFSCLNESKTADNFILSCDMPLMTSDFVKFVVSKKADYEVVIPVFNGMAEPLCAYYHKNITSPLKAQIKAGVYKIQEAVKPLHTLLLEIEDSNVFNDSKLFMNINSEVDLGIAKRLLESQND
ncbi:MAG: molybdenum cofactor guanylyltransferase [Bacteroidales bacterium]